MAVLADRCRSKKVTVVDMDAVKIRAWKGSKLPIFEPGLDKIVKRTRGKNLFFSTDVPGEIERADMIFVCVNTPTKAFGYGAGYASDMQYVEKTAFVFDGRNLLDPDALARIGFHVVPVGKKERGEFVSRDLSQS
jgi:UDPglucose 6-dehydrogenase